MASVTYVWFDSSSCRMSLLAFVSPGWALFHRWICLVSSLPLQMMSDRAKARWGGDDVRRGGGWVICTYLAPWFTLVWFCCGFQKCCCSRGAGQARWRRGDLRCVLVRFVAGIVVGVCRASCLWMLVLASWFTHLLAIGFVLYFASFVFCFLSINSAAWVLSDLAFRSPVSSGWAWITIYQWMSMKKLKQSILYH